MAAIHRDAEVPNEGLKRTLRVIRSSALSYVEGLCVPPLQGSRSLRQNSGASPVAEPVEAAGKDLMKEWLLQRVDSAAGFLAEDVVDGLFEHGGARGGKRGARGAEMEAGRMRATRVHGDASTKRQKTRTAGSCCTRPPHRNDPRAVRSGSCQLLVDMTRGRDAPRHRRIKRPSNRNRRSSREPERRSRSPQPL